VAFARGYLLSGWRWRVDF